MDLIFTILMIVAGLNVGLALLIFLRNPKNKINISLALSVFSVSIWIFGEAMFDKIKDLDQVFFWARFENTFGALVVIFFFFFTLFFPFQHKRLNLFEKSLVVLSLAFLFPLFWSKWYVQDVTVNLVGSNDFYLNIIGRVSYAFYFLIYLSVSFHWLIKKYIISSGALKKNLITVIFATGFIALFGTAFGVFVPLLFGVDNAWYVPLFSLPMVFILTFFVLFGHKEIRIK